MKPLAPTCRMCLIRDDLTTVWCEVTSSVRNKSSEEDSGEELTTNSKSTESSETSGTKIDQEILLCLRPIRNGGKKVDESMRFVSTKNSELPLNSPRNIAEESVSSNSNSAGMNRDSDSTLTRNNPNNSSSSSLNQKKRPPKKRSPTTTVNSSLEPNQKRTKQDSSVNGLHVSETDVVESLILMNKSWQ
mgnify:CR=1 FL=1